MRKAQLIALVVSATIPSVNSHAAGLSMSMQCVTENCVYDSHNQIIGIAEASSHVWRTINGKKYDMTYTNVGFSHLNAFFYTEPECASQPYIMTGYTANFDNVLYENQPVPAYKDSRGIWGATGPLEAVLWQSYRYGTTTADCVTYDSKEYVVGRAATIIDTSTFYPPFGIK